jgi:hypothetical protein
MRSASSTQDPINLFDYFNPAIGKFIEESSIVDQTLPADNVCEYAPAGFLSTPVT